MDWPKLDWPKSALTIWSSGATAFSFPGIPRRVAHHSCRMEVAITNQEAGPEDLDVHDHGSIDPTLLDSLVDLGVRELDEDQCSSAGSESCWGETESIGDDEVVEWGTLPLPSSIKEPLHTQQTLSTIFRFVCPVHTSAGWEPPGARVPHRERGCASAWVESPKPPQSLVSSRVAITLHLHLEPAQR